MLNPITLLKQLFCKHEYKRVRQDIYPDGHEEDTYVCKKCHKEKHIVF